MNNNLMLQFAGDYSPMTGVWEMTLNSGRVLQDMGSVLYGNITVTSYILEFGISSKVTRSFFTTATKLGNALLL